MEAIFVVNLLRVPRGAIFPRNLETGIAYTSLRTLAEVVYGPECTMKLAKKSDTEEIFIDSTVIGVHRRVAGAPKNGTPACPTCYDKLSGCYLVFVMRALISN